MSETSSEWDFLDPVLARALDEYNARKAEILGDAKLSQGDPQSVLLAPYGLPVEQLMELKEHVAATGLEDMIVHGIRPDQIIGGMWLDGLITGIIVERLRS